MEETNNIADVLNFIPNETYEILSSSNICFNQNMYKLLRYKILTLGKENIKNIYDVSEGLENKIYDSVIDSNTYIGTNYAALRFGGSHFYCIFGQRFLPL